MKGTPIVTLFLAFCVLDILSASIEGKNAIDQAPETAEERTFGLLALSAIFPLMRKYFHAVMNKVAG